MKEGSSFSLANEKKKNWYKCEFLLFVTYKECCAFYTYSKFVPTMVFWKDLCLILGIRYSFSNSNDILLNPNDTCMLIPLVTTSNVFTCIFFLCIFSSSWSKTGMRIQTNRFYSGEELKLSISIHREEISDPWKYLVQLTVLDLSTSLLFIVTEKKVSNYWVNFIILKCSCDISI